MWEGEERGAWMKRWSWEFRCGSLCSIKIRIKMAMWIKIKIGMKIKRQGHGGYWSSCSEPKRPCPCLSTAAVVSSKSKSKWEWKLKGLAKARDSIKIKMIIKIKRLGHRILRPWYNSSSYVPVTFPPTDSSCCQSPWREHRPALLSQILHIITRKLTLHKWKMRSGERYIRSEFIYLKSKARAVFGKRLYTFDLIQFLIDT